MWFCEQMNSMGEWHPVLFHGVKPTTKTVSGVVRLETTTGVGQRVRNMKKVKAEHFNLPATAIMQMYAEPDFVGDAE